MMSQRTKPKRRTGLFGGSFNPPHLGHTAICRWVFNRGIADQVWVIPCFVHPFGKGLAPFDDRLAMCRMAFMDIGLPIEVLDIEQRLGGVSFTLRTIEYLKGLHPDMRFLLITGEDIREDTSDWCAFEKIRKLVELKFIPRGPKSPIPDISSTEIRRSIGSGLPYSHLVEKDVAGYIDAKGLFRKKSKVQNPKFK